MRTWRREIKGLTLAATVLAGAPVASASVVYVDATAGSAGNTTLADGSAFNPPLNGTTGTDNNWEQRTTFGSGGNIFESSGEVSSEDAPQLRTTVSGLIPGQAYNVYAMFWDPSSTTEDWNLRAGLTAGSLTLFARADAVGDPALPGAVAAGLASGLTYTTAPTIFLESARDLLAADLGTAVADANGQLPVYIDDLAQAGTVNRRSWYDGVAVSVVPEPAALSLLAIGGLMMGRRRRT